MARFRWRAAVDYRMLTVILLVLTCWGVIGYRLFQVQVVDASDYREAAESQRIRVRETTPARGVIYDRQGRVMAVSVDSRSVYADPRQIENPAGTAAVLGGLLRLDIARLEKRLRSDASFVFVARQLDDELADEVESLEFPGIHFTTEPKRMYPSGPLGSHVLGFVDVDSKGIEGLESFYDVQLAGAPGRILAETAPGGLLIPQGRHEIEPAVPGMDLITTLDREVQFTSEQACRDALEQSLAQRCTVVVLDARTFEVLAMAVIPTFDPGDRRTLDPSSGVLTNTAVRAVYEPGSTQKLVTVTAAIEEGVVDWNTLYLVPDTIEVVEGACELESDGEDGDGGEDGEVEEAVEILGCYRDFSPHKDEVMSVKDCLRESSNVCMVKIAQDLGAEKLEKYLEGFGYGRGTGIDYPGEASGEVNLEYGCSTCPTSAAIGYSLSVTPLQLAGVYAAIANDGVWRQPRLVSSVVDGEGRRLTEAGASRRVVSEDTARIMRALLREVVDNGTGRLAAVPGYSVGGKTGTARKFNYELRAYGDEFLVSFVGMSPVDDPRLVAAVMVDSPQLGLTGGSVAAPVFARVMERALHQLGVPADA